MEEIILRVATQDDIRELKQLIRASAHGLSKDDYTPQQVDAALQGVFGVDTQLIKDQTYFVLVHQNQLIGCGGWSFRATLFGSDDIADRNSRRLDPNNEAAKIRAFFIHPDYARQGLAKRLLQHCERCARDLGFTKAELGSTLPGLKFYQASGYLPGQPLEHAMENGMKLRIIPMSKQFS